MRVLPAQPPRAPSKFWQPQSHPPSMDTIPTLHKLLNEVGLVVYSEAAILGYLFSGMFFWFNSKFTFYSLVIR